MATTTAESGIEGFGRAASLAETARENSSSRRLAPFLLALPIASIFVLLWQLRGEGHLTPETGVGYALGIAGVTATLMLLAYPVRKRARILRGWGRIDAWFRWHMILGLIAPTLILLHCNFSFGSLNSAVALVSMLIVAGSGVVGRMIYTRIHFGLYGARASLSELRDAISGGTREAGDILGRCPSTQARLVGFADTSLAPASNVLNAAARVLLIGARARWLRLIAARNLKSEIRYEAKTQDWSSHQRRAEKRAAMRFVRLYLGTVRKAVQLTFYERLFALWHVLHIPLFFMLLLATVAHIVAVHMY